MVISHLWISLCEYQPQRLCEDPGPHEVCGHFTKLLEVLRLQEAYWSMGLWKDPWRRDSFEVSLTARWLHSCTDLLRTVVTLNCLTSFEFLPCVYNPQLFIFCPSFVVCHRTFHTGVHGIRWASSPTYFSAVLFGVTMLPSASIVDVPKYLNEFATPLYQISKILLCGAAILQ